MAEEIHEDTGKKSDGDVIDFKILKDRGSELDKEEKQREDQPPSIYRADYFLTDSQKKLFGSSYLSLGLFDRCSWDRSKINTQLDKLKIDVLIAFLADVGPKAEKLHKEWAKNWAENWAENWRELCTKIVKEPAKWKTSYDFHTSLTDGQIQCALALDAVFVLCWISYFVYGDTDLKRASKCLSRQNEVIKSKLLYDIFKMENQIPLPILRKVMAVRYDGWEREEDKKDYMENILSYPISAYIQEFPMRDAVFGSCDRNLTRRIFNAHHLLHGAAILSSLSTEKTKSKLRSCSPMGNNNNDGYKQLPNDDSQSSRDHDEQIVPVQETEVETVLKAIKAEHMPRAEELNRSGISFQGQNDFFPKFKRNTFRRWRGTLFLPRLSIGVHTAQCWKSFIDWEATAEESKKPFTKYLILMNHLIDTDSDVSLLLRETNSVIYGVGLGSNQDVADLFNSIVSTALSGHGLEGEWEALYKSVNDFYAQEGRKMVLNFVSTYLGSPWLVISFNAALFLLILQVIQALYSIWDYYRD